MVISGQFIGQATAKPGSTDFDPSDKAEVAEYIASFFKRVSEANSRTESFERGHSKASEWEVEIRSLSDRQRRAIQNYLKKYSGVTYEADSRFSVGNEKDSSTTSAWSRADYTETIKAYLEVPNPNPIWGDDTLEFHAFDYSQTLEWYYDGDKVKNAEQSTTPNGQYYVIVGWSFNKDKEKDLKYHPNDYYVESETEAVFNRVAFADPVVSQNDYATIEVAGYGYGNGRTMKKTVNDRSVDN